MNIVNAPQIPLLELDLMKTLVAIAETGNFSSAAEVVFRTPSAISMQVKKIEELVERPVFIRDSRSVTLTPDGLLLLEHARRVLALNNEMVSRFVTPDIEGEVRLGAGDDFSERMLPEMLRRFACSHPQIVVEVIVENSDKLIEQTRNGQIDISIITSEAGYAKIDDAEVLMREKLVWAALKGGIALEQDPLPISVWEEGCSWRKAGLDSLEQAGRDYRIAFRSAYIGGQKAAILSDLAVAPLPVSSLGGDIVCASGLDKLPELPTYSLSMIIRDNPSKAVSAAADHMRASFAARS